MSPERRRLGNLGRRYTDRKWPRHLRDFWLLAITVVTLLALLHATDAVNEVQQGRRIGSRISCAALSAVAQEGRKVLSGSAQGLSGPFERFLEAHGYPPRSVREKAARRAGEAYVRDISQRVEQAVGHRGDGLIRPDGTIDCHKLQDVTGT